MPELILLQFDRNEIIALNRASRNGDAEASKFFTTLWNDYRDRALACFLCDAVVEFPVFSESLVISPMRPRPLVCRCVTSAASCPR